APPACSVLVENQVNDPAAADVLAGFAAVFQDRLLRAAGLFEGVGEQRHILEAAVFVHSLRQGDHSTMVPGKPRIIHPARSVRVLKNVAEQSELSAAFRSWLRLSSVSPRSLCCVIGNGVGCLASCPVSPRRCLEENIISCTVRPAVFGG